MSEKENSFDLDKFLENNSLLKNTKLRHFYTLLDNKKVEGKCTSEIYNNGSKGYLCSLYQHVGNIFNEWNSICPSSEKDEAKCCDYFNYWLYGKITKSDMDFSDIAWIYNRLSEFMHKKESNTKIKQICEDKFKIETSIDVLKNKKVLYEFLEYYDYITSAWSSNAVEKEEFCRYIIYVFNLYQKLEEEGRQLGTLHRYKNEIKLFKEKFSNEENLSLLKQNCKIYDTFIKKFEVFENLTLLQRNHEKQITRPAKPSDYVEYNEQLKSEYDKVLIMLPSDKIYKELGREFSNDDKYDSIHCNDLSDNIKNICKKIIRNLKELLTIDKFNNENHKDLCTYLNFWIYDELYKLHRNRGENILDITDVHKLLDAYFKINYDLIKKDFEINYKSKVGEPPPRPSKTSKNAQNPENSEVTQSPSDSVTLLTSENLGAAEPNGSEVPQASNGAGVFGPPNAQAHPGALMENTQTRTPKKEAPKLLSYKELTNYKPCFFNYNCLYSECREMKHLYEYFRNYDAININVNCEKMENYLYLKYLKYINSLYKMHKNECCSYGAELCTDYFLRCDKAYNPQNLISALESRNREECKRIKESIKPNTSEDSQTINANSEDNMFIKYLTCSRVNDSEFKNKGLRCQEPQHSPHLKNQHSPRGPVKNQQTSASQLYGKQITLDGKTVNAVLISDNHRKITGENENSATRENPESPRTSNLYTFFPEVTRSARKNYIREAKTACSDGKTTSEYCRKSKKYKAIINSANYNSKYITNESGVGNVDDDTFTIDSSSTNSILQNLPFRIGVVILITLGAIFTFFLYYKFTPFGSWLRYRIKGKKKNKYMYHREPSHKSLNYPEERMHQGPRKKKIHIVYHNS
ncbi:variable surface protein [Plasmodium gonderi]|uniref:Variable surface protein n=1 Tax=Plasmodium gonderi TaxID=77519 RepID=A0A1Y1JT44_PLAGO|nr:variable surface protein [Plasmodium gonderi]GAW84608.1 variable surface protein [Plasmodium gonderi]